MDRKTVKDGGDILNPPKKYVVLEVAEPFEVLDAALCEHLERCDGTGKTKREELTPGSVRYPIGHNAQWGYIVLRKTKGPTSIMRLEEVAAAWRDRGPDFSELTEESLRAQLKRLVSSLDRQSSVIHCLFRRLDNDPAYTSGVDWNQLRRALEELRARSSPALSQLEGKPERPPGPFIARGLRRDGETIRDWNQPFPVSTPRESVTPVPTEPDEPSDAVTKMLDRDFKKGSGRYGSYRSLSEDDVRAIVYRCRQFQMRGGKVPDFHRQLNMDPTVPPYFEIETLRHWLYNKPEFAAEEDP